jgi:hypothetical protein
MLPPSLLLQFISSRDEIDEEYQRRLKEQMKKKRTTSLKTSSVTSTGEPSPLTMVNHSINAIGIVPWE